MKNESAECRSRPQICVAYCWKQVNSLKKCFRKFERLFWICTWLRWLCFPRCDDHTVMFFTAEKHNSQHININGTVWR